jgi:3-hydroxyisobutyryl-CoA hydrolase
MWKHFIYQNKKDLLTIKNKLLKKNNYCNLMNKKPFEEREEEEILIEQIYSTNNESNTFKILLNRPKSFNALNLNMIRKLIPWYKKWILKPETIVIMKGAGDKAFCAGGDIRAIYDAGKNSTIRGSGLTSDFFYEEYILNNMIASKTFHHIALLNGITMGGGVGLSVHGKYRIVNENTVFAMPETAIGFFCDVGGTYFLPRLPSPQSISKGNSLISSSNPTKPSSLGMYLALTGTRLKGHEVVLSGIGTHYVTANKFKELEQKLTQVSPSRIEEVLYDFNEKFPFTSEIIERAEDISLCFSKESVEEIILELKNLEHSSNEKSKEWAKKTLSTLNLMSPTSLKVVHRQLYEGCKLNYEECFKLEYNISQAFMNSHDFFEGVRATLVDKDKNPKWKPNQLKEVTKEMIDKYFQKAIKEWNSNILFSKI